MRARRECHEAREQRGRRDGRGQRWQQLDGAVARDRERHADGGRVTRPEQPEHRCAEPREHPVARRRGERRAQPDDAHRQQPELDESSDQIVPRGPQRVAERARQRGEVGNRVTGSGHASRHEARRQEMVVDEEAPDVARCQRVSRAAQPHRVRQVQPVALALDGREARREIEDGNAELVGDGDEPLALHLAGGIRAGRARQCGDHGDQTSARGRDLVTQRRQKGAREIDVVLAFHVRRGVGKRTRRGPRHRLHRPSRIAEQQPVERRPRPRSGRRGRRRGRGERERRRRDRAPVEQRDVGLRRHAAAERGEVRRREGRQVCHRIDDEYYEVGRPRRTLAAEKRQAVVERPATRRRVQHLETGATPLVGVELEQARDGEVLGHPEALRDVAAEQQDAHGAGRLAARSRRTHETVGIRLDGRRRHPVAVAGAEPARETGHVSPAELDAPLVHHPGAIRAQAIALEARHQLPEDEQRDGADERGAPGTHRSPSRSSGRGRSRMPSRSARSVSATSPSRPLRAARTRSRGKRQASASGSAATRRTPPSSPSAGGRR